MTDRYIISGGLELQAPMHLGDGGDQPFGEMDKSGGNPDHEPPPSDAHVATVARDKDGKPFVPGSSLKGALRAMAVRLGRAGNWLELVFGAQGKGGCVQFQAAYCQLIPTASGLPSHSPAQGLAIIPHTAIDRVTRTVVERKLFQQSVVPPKTRFSIRLVVQGLSPAELQSFIWLLGQMTTEPMFGLGSGHGESRTRVRWAPGQQPVRRFGKPQFVRWITALATTDSTWASACGNFELGKLPEPRTAPVPDSRVVRVPVRLDFHTPFLVAQRQKKGRNNPNMVPRLNHDKLVVLPESGFVGALRSQCERILRTLGMTTRQGHECAVHRKGGAFDDLAAALFGAPGWAATVTSGDFTPVDDRNPALPTQDFVAIDRVIGGGKDSAKFSVKHAECPKLQGGIAIDLKRLAATGKSKEALGLLALALRDLQEGDITFGHGRSKGFGHCTAQGLVVALNNRLTAAPESPGSADECLVEFRLRIANVPHQMRLNPDGPQIDQHQPQHAHPAGAGNFHNPKAFIPFARPEVASWQAHSSLHASHHSHDSYREFSGRMVFELESTTPIFIGAGRRQPQSEGPIPVDPFLLNGTRAIPATSLRGVMSAVFETVSASNLRVLDDSYMSTRVAIGNGLSAFGRIVVRGHSTWLEPLALPTLRMDRGDRYVLPPGIANVFAHFGDQAPLRVYFDSTSRFSAAANYYMRLMPITLVNEVNRTSIECDVESLRFAKGNRNFMIGCLGKDQQPLSHDEWVERIDKDHFTRGYVRTLKGEGRDLPRGVRHFQFIPHPAECDGFDDEERGLKLVPQHVLQQFERLADEVSEPHRRTAETTPESQVLPYVPIGRVGQNRTPANDYKTQLVDGDLVLFDVDLNGEISEISFSAIWRREVGNAAGPMTIGGFLKLDNEGLLPLGVAALKGGNRRNSLSPAELLFGVVEDMGSSERAQGENDRSAMAFSGKVRIGIGRAVTKVECLPAVTLKELSSAKLPSPSMYFKPANGQAFVSKSQLSKSPTEFRLKGVGAFLHAWRTPGQGNEPDAIQAYDDHGVPAAPNQGRMPWVSKNNGRMTPDNKRRIQVAPIAAGQKFYFEVDFDNLDQTELRLLCAAMQPFDGYEHKIGMGKPIGLGSVRAKALGLFLVDRFRRYAADGLHAARYACHSTSGAETLPSHLHVEAALLSAPSTLDVTPSDLASAGFASVLGATRRAMQLIGNPVHTVAPVHYPQTQTGQLESKHYDWFVRNDDLGAQRLGDIEPSTAALPTLRRN